MDYFMTDPVVPERWKVVVQNGPITASSLDSGLTPALPRHGMASDSSGPSDIAITGLTAKVVARLQVVVAFGALITLLTAGKPFAEALARRLVTRVEEGNRAGHVTVTVYFYD
jgi:hypothetical protein